MTDGTGAPEDAVPPPLEAGRVSPGSRLAEVLRAREQQLTAGLGATRAEFDHTGNRGIAAETAVRDFLSHHLTRHLDVGDGEVIDSFGNRSRQMDVVITTEDQPFRQAPSEPGLCVIEGVYAVAEVKSNLTHFGTRGLCPQGPVNHGSDESKF
jgi:hypothetical protein